MWVGFYLENFVCGEVQPSPRPVYKLQGKNIFFNQREQLV